MSTAAAQSVARFDRGEIRGRAERTDDGYIRAQAVVTRTGVFLYQNADGSIRRELRHPDDVFRAESLATLEMIPITDGHPPERLVDAKTVGERAVGNVGEEVTVDGRHVLASLVVNREDGVRSLERGRQELSLGYRADVIAERGEYNGEPYDHRQTNIRYNHLALVDRARAGREARINLDAEDAVQVDDEPQQTRTDMSDVTLETVVLDGITYKAAPEVKRALEKAQTRADEADAAEQQLETLQEKHDALEGERDELKEKVEKLEKADHSEEIQKAVRRRIDLERRAAKVIGDEEDVSGLTDRELMEKVIRDRHEDLELEERSDAYVEARFDAVVEAAGDGPSPAARKSVRDTTERHDGGGGDNRTVEDARDGFHKRLQGAWRSDDD